MPTTAMMAAMIHKVLAFMLGAHLPQIRPMDWFSRTVAVGLGPSFGGSV
jgi:hypothetical protein